MQRSTGYSVRLDLDNSSLWRGKKQVPLRPKTLAVLLYLLDHPGQLVTKEAILKAVWPGVVVTDIVLGVCISELRQALGDKPNRPIWIKTIYKHGYNYIGDPDIVSAHTNSI